MYYLIGENMSIFNIQTKQSSNVYSVNVYGVEVSDDSPPNLPIINHPSEKRFADIHTTILINEFGLMESDRPIKIFIKDKSSPNGSIASGDVVVKGSYTPKSFRDIKLNTTKLCNNFPTLSQDIGMCQSFPFLHIIQSQLNFPMDYKSLWDCLDGNREPYDDYGPNRQRSGYARLFDLLLSGKCFRVKQDPCRDEIGETRIGSKNFKPDCNNPCDFRFKIRTVKEPKVTTEQELCERINTLGPRQINSWGLTTMKLLVLRDKEKGSHLTWDDVKDMSFSELNTYLVEPWSTTSPGTGHALTIMACEDGKFQVKNCWGANNEIIWFSFADLKKYFLDINDFGAGGLITSVFGFNLDYYPIVEPCTENYPDPSRSDFINPKPPVDLNKCKEDICKSKGYDILKADSSHECDCDECCYCDCDQVAVPNDAALCLNKGQIVKRIMRQLPDSTRKRCYCPNHSNPNFYEYVEKSYLNSQKIPQRYCCEQAFAGAWCEKIYCEQTQTYYQNGVEKRGLSTEYLHLEADGFADDWEKKPAGAGGVWAKESPCSNNVPPSCENPSTSSSSSSTSSSSSSSSSSESDLSTSSSSS